MAAAVIAIKKRSRHLGALWEQAEAVARDIPEPDQRIKEGVLHKRVITANSFWCTRRFILTADNLTILRENEETIIDHIPLLEIDAIRSANNHPERTRRQQLAHQASFINSPDFGFGDINLFSRLDDSRAPASAVEECFEIKTIPEGYNGRRTYQLRCSSKEECDEWVKAIETAAKDARVRQLIAESPNIINSMRHRIKQIYDTPAAQGIIGLTILANFITSIVFAQANPDEDTTFFHVLEGLDLGFTIFFALELVVNMVANWFHRFWRADGCGWNYFDVVVVTLSLIAIPLDDVEGLSSLRLIRVFRVVRLFERLTSLRKIISALTSAVIPVANAFVVLFIVTGIYAVIGVSLFKHDNDTAFGNFAASLFTLFQVLTGDSWASTIARPMFEQRGAGVRPEPLVVFYFVSYILVCGTFLLNVVIAVLLDEFISAVEREKQRTRAREEEGALSQTLNRGGALDPLLLTLTKFHSQEDLTNRIRAIYRVLDVDDSGGLNYTEMIKGFRRLDVHPPIHFSKDDFEIVTEGMALCNEKGEVDAEHFEYIVRAQLKRFMERQMAVRINQAENTDPHIATLLFCLKHIMFMLESTQQGESLTRPSSANGDGSASVLPTKLPEMFGSRGGSKRNVIRPQPTNSAGQMARDLAASWQSSPRPSNGDSLPDPDSPLGKAPPPSPPMSRVAKAAQAAREQVGVLRVDSFAPLPSTAEEETPDGKHAEERVQALASEVKVAEQAVRALASDVVRAEGEGGGDGENAQPQSERAGGREDGGSFRGGAGDDTSNTNRADQTMDTELIETRSGGAGDGKGSEGNGNGPETIAALKGEMWSQHQQNQQDWQRFPPQPPDRRSIPAQHERDDGAGLGSVGQLSSLASASEMQHLPSASERHASAFTEVEPPPRGERRRQGMAGGGWVVEGGGREWSAAISEPLSTEQKPPMAMLGYYHAKGAGVGDA